MSVTVTVTDNATGETETKTIENDVLVIVEGTAHVAGVQDYRSTGTQVWTIKGVGCQP